MGLVVFVAMGLYLLVSIGVVKGAVVYARKSGKSAIRWGFGAALLMYLIPFWDWIPTVAMHRYYCATEAGFWEYKTLEQWKAENPGVMEELRQITEPIQATDYGDLQVLDERFAIETRRSRPIPFLTTNISERVLIDRKTKSILAKGVDVGSGVGHIATGGGFKFWLNQEPCRTGGIWNITTELQHMRGTK